MKILVINNDFMERSIIQQALQHDKHEIIPAGDSATAMRLLQEGDIRFVIADRAATDIDETQFIKQLRDAEPPYYIYVLLLTPRAQNTDFATSRSGADDYLYKPIAPIELKTRVQIGERMLGLADNLVQAKGALENTAMFDPLTNMLNPKAFLTLTRGELERARRNQAPLSLIALSVNNFNQINQKHGEAVGNDVLTVISQVIREKSRPYDGTGHYERDLFLLPLPFVIGPDAEKIAARLFKGIMNADISLLDGAPVSVNLHIAIVSASRVTPAMEVEALVEKAREILARLKPVGGNQVDMVFI